MKVLLSNCCGAEFLGEVSDGCGMCGACGEWAGVMEPEEIEEQFWKDEEGNDSLFYTPEYSEYLDAQNRLAINLANRDIEEFEREIVKVRDFSWAKFWGSIHETRVWERTFGEEDRALEYMMDVMESLGDEEIELNY